MVKIIALLRLAVLVTFMAIALPHGFAQGGTPAFQPHNIPQSEGTPTVTFVPPSKPIPRALLIAGAAVVTIVAVVVLIFAIRAWRASNLFGRQYRLPSVESAALRFGGTRNGGLMAVVEPAKDKANA